MKRFTFFLLIYFCCGSFMMAQEEDFLLPTSVSEMKCGQGPKNLVEKVGGSDSPASRPKAKFATSDLALDDLVSAFLKKLKCIHDCNPDSDTCAVVVIGYKSKPSLIHKDDPLNWNFSGNVAIEWRCSNCGVLKAKPNTGHHYSFGEIEKPLDSPTGAAFYTVFPNPSTGLINLELSTAKEHGEVLIKVFDLRGQVVEQELYQADPDSKFLAQVDLSALNNGIYWISTFVDDQLIGTSQVMIQ